MEEKWVIEENKSTTTSIKKKAAEADLTVETAKVDEDEQSSLDLLAIDSDTIEDTHESAEEIADYASFLASYNALMAERLAKARSASTEKTEKEDNPEESETAKDAPKETNAEESVEQDSEPENGDTVDETPEDEEVEIIVKEDIEFHKEIVSKSERGNAEDHIVLVAKHEESEPADDETESVAEAQTNENTESGNTEHSFSYEEYEKEAQLAPETLEYDPNQISMVIGEEQKEEPTDPSRYDEKHPRIVDHAFDFIEMLVITLMAAIVITSLFFRFSFVDGHSMDRTLSDGDTLIISNLFYTPDYGDIVVIEYENNIHEVKPLIKRVIGLPGDVIKVTAEGDVYRNGELLNEEKYVYLDGPLFATLKGEWKVGEGEVFVMGDHRNDSMDSREIGPIKIDKIIGQAVFRLFPLSDFGKID